MAFKLLDFKYKQDWKIRTAMNMSSLREEGKMEREKQVGNQGLNWGPWVVFVHGNMST